MGLVAQIYLLVLIAILIIVGITQVSQSQIQSLTQDSRDFSHERNVQEKLVFDMSPKLVSKIEKLVFDMSPKLVSKIEASGKRAGPQRYFRGLGKA